MKLLLGHNLGLVQIDCPYIPKLAGSMLLLMGGFPSTSSNPFFARVKRPGNAERACSAVRQWTLGA